MGVVQLKLLSPFIYLGTFFVALQGDVVALALGGRHHRGEVYRSAAAAGRRRHLRRHQGHLPPGELCRLVAAQPRRLEVAARALDLQLLPAGGCRAVAVVAGGGARVAAGALTRLLAPLLAGGTADAVGVLVLLPLQALVLVAGAVTGVPAAAQRLAAGPTAGKALHVAEDALPLLQWGKDIC